MEDSQNYFMAALKVLGALGLLIYGMRMMSEALQKMVGAQLRHVLGRMTSNRFMGMLTGTAVTCAVQSSSATTVITVSFVSAGLLTLGQAISVIMGANIGTTLTAWIMSLGYNVDLTAVVFPAFFVGMVLIYKKRHRYFGDFLFGVAFLFFSLVMLSTTGRELDLEHNEDVVSFFASFDTDSHWTIIIFLLIGTLITCLVQSSAAVMAITILLCSTGVLPIYLGIALVMGENIGTTATANLAALGSGTEARRAALAHLLFNVFGVLWILVVFYPFVDMVCRLVGYDPTASGQQERLPVVLAMFHTCFNVTNTAILIGFIPQMERVVCWLLPKQEQSPQEEFQLRYIQANLVQTPEIAVLQAQKEIIFFGSRVHKMFGMIKDMLSESDTANLPDLFAQVENQEDLTDQTEITIAQYLEQVSADHLSDDTKTKIREMLRIVGELESIGDSCRNMARTINRQEELSLTFGPETKERMQAMMRLCDAALGQMEQALVGRRSTLDKTECYRIDREIKEMQQQLRNVNITSVSEQQYDYAVGTLFDDFINECGKLSNYVVNVVQARAATASEVA